MEHGEGFQPGSRIIEKCQVGVGRTEREMWSCSIWGVLSDVQVAVLRAICLFVSEMPK